MPCWGGDSVGVPLHCTGQRLEVPASAPGHVHAVCNTWADVQNGIWPLADVRQVDQNNVPQL
ncbi:unnamed protein product [Symbiodinium pilosum]|uniref:Uncharacterized protein n=1 Tax=Symbiodinium pilosum TaxID=2952 RepID=A0A812T7L3_SYMPI|nr:unnamed protein product [Symbiodinium pilosum]